MIGDVPGAEPPSAAHQFLSGATNLLSGQKSETDRLSPGSATEYLLVDDDVLFE
jgi:hypothetical protein